MGGDRCIVDRVVVAVSAAGVKLRAAVHAEFPTVREMAPCGNYSAPPGLAGSYTGLTFDLEESLHHSTNDHRHHANGTIDRGQVRLIPAAKLCAFSG